MVFPSNHTTLSKRQPFVRQRGWLVALALLLISLAGWAQTFPLQVQVSVLPPYSAYLQDYPGAGQQVRVFIINTSRSTYQIRLAGQLTGDNGIEIRTAANYRPPRPLTVPPGQTLLSRTDLEGLFDLNQVEVTGIDKNQLARGLPLPDGTYQLCIRAFNETPTNTAAVAFGQPLSAEFPIGCSAPITVRSVEPPILIAPLCDAEVTATNPQALVFTWTPPAGVSPVSVEYILRVVELPQVDVDPNVFIDAVALPRSGVEVRGLRTSTFLYGPTQPPLQLGKRYAWRVQAVDRRGRLHFLNDGKAPVCSFTYGTGLPPLTKTPGLELVQTPGKLIPASIDPSLTAPAGATAVADKVPAKSPAPEQKMAKSSVVCKTIDLPDDQKPQTASLSGKTIKLGEFDLTIADDKVSNGVHTGTGRVSWNGAPIKVTFTDLQVNAANQAFNGTVKSDSKGPGMPKITPGSLGSYASLPPDYFDKITNTVSNAAGRAIAVPLPIKYDGKIGTIGVNDMVFSPVGATMDLVLGVSLPEANSTLLLAATDVCTRPSQVIPKTGLVYLVQDFTVPGIGQTLKFRKKDPDDAKTDGTFANVKDGDFEKIHAVLDLNLGGKILKLDDGAGGTKTGDVVSTITTDFVKWADWIGTLTLPDFQLPLLSGVTFAGSEILYDHSSVRNVDGFSLPDEYKDDKGPTFEGIYFKKLNVLLPKALKNNPRITISVNGGVVDGSGFTGVITTTSTPVMDYKKENIAGFGFGIDHIQWTIVQNSNRGGSMLGQLQFPISTDAFSYSCNLSAGFDDLQFAASPKDGYVVPLFAANMNLNKNTAITVGYKTGKSIEVNITLGGTVAIDVKKFAGSGLVGKALEAVIPNLYFEKFALGNVKQPGASEIGGSGLYMNTGFWDLKPIDPAKLQPGSNQAGGGPWTPDEPLPEWLAAPSDNQQASVGGFPLSFDKPTVIGTPDGAGVRLGAKLHVGEADDDKSFVQVSGTVDVLGTITKPDGRFVPAYKGTYPQSLSINGAVGPLTVSGGLQFIDKDNVYGDGMKGNASVTLPGFGVGIKMAMLFGNVIGYKYSFIDGSVQFPAGIPIVGPIMLTGLGGGMHYNMNLGVGKGTITSLPKPTASNSDKPAPVDLTKPGTTLSGQTYTPNKGGWGFTAKIYAGLADPHVLNTSLALTIDFAGGAMSGVNMHGNANVISKSGDGDGSDGIAHAEMDVTYAHGVLDASLPVTANLLTASAKVPLLIHSSGSSDWFVKLGDPGNDTNRISVTLLDLHEGPVTAFLGAKGYLATGVGPNLGGLPPVPQKVIEFLDGGEGSTLASASKAYHGRSLPSLMPVGKDYKLLIGGRIDATLKVQVEPFRLWATALAGFDVGLAKNMTCGGSTDAPEGVNGWYGQGQAYVYLGGGIDLYVDTWFYSGSVSLMELQAGAVLTAGTPNPTWADGEVKIAGSVLDGLISVETTQHFSFGDKCVPVYNGDPLKDIEIISQLTPANDDSEVSTLPTMAVSFNMPMNKVFTIYISSDDIRYYKFIPDAPVFQVKAKGGTYQPVTKVNAIDWAADYRSYTLSANAFLPSYATCQLTQRIVIKQLVNSYDKTGQDPYNDKTGKQEARSQEKTTTFTLTKQPDDIPQAMITGAWPVEGQRHFLRKQTDKGFLRATTLDGLDCLKPQTGTQLVAIFNGPGGEVLTQPADFNGTNLITFSIPNGLKNKQNYVLEISRIAKTANAGSTSKPLTNSGYVTMAQSPKLQLYRTTLNASAVQAMAAINAANQRKKLFGITFSTSQYDTFADKLNALNLRATDYSGDQTIELKPMAGTYERFDKIDLFGGKVYDNFTLPSLLSYTAPVVGTSHANTPYEKEIRTMIYDRMKQLATDNTGQYYSAGANQGQTDDFKPETLGQYYTGDNYDRETYNGVIGSVQGQPQRVVTYSGHGPMGYNPVSSANKFSFLRDRLAFDDLTALSGILKAMRRLNYYDVLVAKKYSPDKNLSDQSYVAKYIHDPNAESAAIYDKSMYSTYYKESFDNANYKQIEGETYNAYGQIVSGSPSMQLYLQTFNGTFYRKMQYWKFAEDTYYQERQAYYDQQQAYHSGGPERGKSSPFTVVFSYGYPQEKLLPVKSVTKVFTIGSINDVPPTVPSPPGRSGGRPTGPGTFYLSTSR